MYHHKSNQKNMNVYGYTRINPLRDQPKKLTIASQKRMIQQHAKAQGWKIQTIFSDVSSPSSTIGHHSMQQLMHLIVDKQVDVVIVARLDRIARSIRAYHSFLEAIVSQNVQFISIEEDIDIATEKGQLAIQILHYIYLWDARGFSDRTKEIVENKRRIGENVGHAPFGYIYRNKKLIPDEKENKIVQLICEKRDQEELSYHKIAKFLNQHRIPTKRGKTWYAETVKNIYTNRPHSSKE